MQTYINEYMICQQSKQFLFRSIGNNFFWSLASLFKNSINLLTFAYLPIINDGIPSTFKWNDEVFVTLFSTNSTLNQSADLPISSKVSVPHVNPKVKQMIVMFSKRLENRSCTVCQPNAPKLCCLKKYHLNNGNRYECR